MWYNSLSFCRSGIINLDRTDHLPTFIQILLPDSTNLNDKNFVKVTFRVNNESNRNLFMQQIDDFDWAGIVTDDIDQYVSRFTAKLDELYCSMFPLKTKCIPTHKALNPWFTTELKELIQQKSVYFNMYRMGFISRQENNHFKNKVKCKIENAKTSYYNKLFQTNYGNARLTWQTLNRIMDRVNCDKLPKSLLGNNIEICDDELMANVFNDYFANVPLQLDDNVSPSIYDPLHFVNPSVENVLNSFTPCNSIEVKIIIENLKITKENKNSMPIRLLKDNKNVLSVVISHMINQSLRMGIFPSSLKRGVITPIFKKRGDPRSPSSYRPITKLPYISKIFEKIIHSRLADHFARNELFTPFQFGFRKNLSTLDAVIHFTENIYDALNSKKSCLNILIDYSRAFDTVNHAILLRKLERYGVRGTGLKLIASYLRDRSQSVCINGRYSNNILTNISVPQGSVLGPFLFLVYITEIPFLSNYFVPTMFADDCTLSLVGDDLHHMINLCNTELATFKSWSDANRLTINVDKTNCLFISNIHPMLPEASILLENHELDVVDCVKFLGLFLDNKLKFDSHINHICNKVSKSIGIIFRIRSLVPKILLRNLYFSLVQPYFLYCLPVFASTYQVHLNPLIKLRKTAIRAINMAGFIDHTNPLFFNSKILKLQDQYKHSLGCYIYDNQNLLNEYSRNHNYSTRNRDLPLVPFARLRITEQSVIRNALAEWDNIPANIRGSRSKQIFKVHYKTFLLNQYISPGEN